MVELYIDVMLPGRGLVGSLGLLLHFVPVGPQLKNMLFGPCVRQKMPIRLLVPSTTRTAAVGREDYLTILMVLTVLALVLVLYTVIQLIAA
jgi:hypothetical protein